MKTVEDLLAFIGSMERVKSHLGEAPGVDENYTWETLRIGPYWVRPVPAFDDFNRAFTPPGKEEKYPDGALSIMSDDDFWAMAVLPLEFQNLSCEELVRAIWGDAIADPANELDPVFRPDSGDPWWNKYWDAVEASRARVSEIHKETGNAVVEFDWEAFLADYMSKH